MTALTAIVALTACGTPPRAQQVDAQAVFELRRVPIDNTVSDPEPAWNPERLALLLKTSTGFAIFSEGQRPIFLTANDRRPGGAPQWITPERIIFGPPVNVVQLTDGRWVPSTEGLSSLTLTGLRNEPRQTLHPSGYRPRVGKSGAYAQIEDRIIEIKPGGAIDDFARGFFAEPQSDGPGVAWNDVPVFEADLWTGKPAPGRLIVRWKPGVVDEYPGLIEPRWCPGLTGTRGLVATALRSTPPANPDRATFFTTVRSDIVRLRGPGSKPELILGDAHSPAPHPLYDLIAAIATDGSLVLSDASGRSKNLAPAASNPTWSHDGSRLAYVEPAAKADELPKVVVLVLGRRGTETSAP